MTAPIPSKRYRNPTEDDYESTESDNSFIVSDTNVIYESNYAPTEKDVRQSHSKRARQELSRLTSQLSKGTLESKGKRDHSHSEFRWQDAVVRALSGKPEAESFIIGREREVKQIIRMIAQPKGGVRPLLLGPIGIGKKSIVRKTACVISSKNCPEILHNRPMILVDCQNLLGCRVTEKGRENIGEYFRHEIEKILKKYKNPILYFRDIDKLIDLENVSDYLKCLLRSNLNCLGSISGDEKEEENQKNIQLLANYNFVVMTVQECSQEETFEIINHKLDKYPLPAQILIPEESLRVAVNLADQYVKLRSFPLKAINLIRETANDVWNRYVLPNGSNSKRKIQITPQSLAKHVQEKTSIPWEDLIATSLERLLLGA